MSLLILKDLALMSEFIGNDGNTCGGHSIEIFETIILAGEATCSVHNYSQKFRRQYLVSENPLNMKHETLQIIRAAIADFLTEREYNIKSDPSKAERFFVWRDRTFVRNIALSISARLIEETWDLNEFSLTGKTLGEYLRDCHVGDIWKTGTEWLECSGIY